MTVEELLRLSNKMIAALDKCNDEALAHTIWERITRYDPFAEEDIKTYSENDCESFTKVMNEIFVKFILKVSNEDIDNIVSIAFEDGISYWCNKTEVVGDQISHGGVVKLYDFDNGDNYTLTKSAMLEGISKAIIDGFFLEYECVKFDDGIITLDTCQVDEEIADAIVQYALFGKIVYK